MTRKEVRCSLLSIGLRIDIWKMAERRGAWIQIFTCKSTTWSCFQIWNQSWIWSYRLPQFRLNNFLRSSWSAVPTGSCSLACTPIHWSTPAPVLWRCTDRSFKSNWQLWYSSLLRRCYLYRKGSSRFLPSSSQCLISWSSSLCYSYCSE